MAFFKKKLFYTTNSSSPQVMPKPGGIQPHQSLLKLLNGVIKISPFIQKTHKKQRGFATVLLLLFCALIITGIAGISLLSVGIKNITRAQSICIRVNMEGQKQLGLLLEKIMALNSSVRFAHKTAQGLKLSIATATASGLFPLIPPLKTKLDLVKQGQNMLKARQDMLLLQSRFVWGKGLTKLKWQFKKINVFRVFMEKPFKKALAVEKQKLGEKAYIYKPQPDFINRQKNRFFWRFRPFAPFDKRLLKIFNITEQWIEGQCVASLKKEEGQWVSTLYH